MSWVSIADALTYTGLTLTDEELATASGLITAYAGRFEDEPEGAIGQRDRRWLGMATAYQAVWLRGKPAVLEQRESHTQTTADGVSVSRPSDSAVMLAPMAARCLRNLSWIGNQTTWQAPLMDRVDRRAFLNESADQWNDWKSLPI